MFERLANNRSFAQRLRKALGKAVRLYPVHSNDNLPGLRRPAGPSLRPNQALACHWVPSADGRHLECRWELAQDDDRSTGHRGRSSEAFSPSIRHDDRMIAPAKVAIY